MGSVSRCFEEDQLRSTIASKRSWETMDKSSSCCLIWFSPFISKSMAITKLLGTKWAAISPVLTRQLEKHTVLKKFLGQNGPHFSCFQLTRGNATIENRAAWKLSWGGLPLFKRSKSPKNLLEKIGQHSGCIPPPYLKDTFYWTEWQEIFLEKIGQHFPLSDLRVGAFARTICS